MILTSLDSKWSAMKWPLHWNRVLSAGARISGRLLALRTANFYTICRAAIPPHVLQLGATVLDRISYSRSVKRHYARKPRTCGVISSLNPDCLPFFRSDISLTLKSESDRTVICCALLLRRDVNALKFQAKSVREEEKAHNAVAIQEARRLALFLLDIVPGARGSNSDIDSSSLNIPQPDFVSKNITNNVSSDEAPGTR